MATKEIPNTVIRIDKREQNASWSTIRISTTNQTGSNHIFGQKLSTNIDDRFYRSGRWPFLQFLVFSVCLSVCFALLCCCTFIFLRKVREYLLYQFDTSGQIHAEVNKHPFDAFFLVLLLFKYEHMMIEELLQFLVGEVDAELLKAVELSCRCYNATSVVRDTAWRIRKDQRWYKEGERKRQKETERERERAENKEEQKNTVSRVRPIVYD